MAYEHKVGEITLYPNDRKTSDRHPDWRVRGKYLDGSEAAGAGWNNETQRGTFIKIKLEQPMPRGASERDEF